MRMPTHRPSKSAEIKATRSELASQLSLPAVQPLYAPTPWQAAASVRVIAHQLVLVPVGLSWRQQTARLLVLEKDCGLMAMAH